MTSPASVLPVGRYLALGSGSAASWTPVFVTRGRPATCVSDNGTEFTSMAILRLVAGDGDRLAITSRQASPPERLRREFQWPLRDELLNGPCSSSLRPGPEGPGGVKDDYNTGHRTAAVQPAAGCLRRLSVSAKQRDGTLRHSGARAPSVCTNEPDRLK